MLVQVHRLCNAVLINAGIGSIGRSLYMALGAAAQRDLSRLVARLLSCTIHRSNDTFNSLAKCRARA